MVNWVDIFKGLLWLGIFFYHFGTPQINADFNRLNLSFKIPTPAGQEIAGAFFLISGYLIARSLIRQATLSPKNISGFYLRRILRIVPSYYLVVVVTYFLLEQQKISGSARYITDMLIFNGNNCLTTGLYGFPQWFFFSNTPLWFISILIKLYLLSPVLYLVLKIFKRNYPAVFLGCILTGVAVRLGIYMIHQPWSGDNGFCDMQLSVSGHIIYYLSGMALAFMEKEKPVTVSKTRIFLIILSVIFWWFTAGYLYGNTGVFQTAILFYLPCLTVVCISAYLLIFNSETLRRSFSKSPIIGGLQKTGRLSFHLYLWHWTVILVVWRYIRLPASVNTYYGILAAALLITFILSLATYFLFDKPFSRRKKR